MEHPQDQEIQMCSNEVPGDTNGQVPRGHSFLDLYSKNLYKSGLNTLIVSSEHP